MVTHHPGYASGLARTLPGWTDRVGSIVRISKQFANLDVKNLVSSDRLTIIGNGNSSRSSIDPGGGAFNDLYIDIPVVAKKIHAMELLCKPRV